MYLIRDTYPRVWGHDKDPWAVIEQGNLLLFTNVKCRQSHLTRAGSTTAREILDRGMPPSYAVQHAELE